jgi:hypothetical protein
MNIYNLDPEIIVVEDILSAEDLKSLQDCANDPEGWDVNDPDIDGTHWEGNQKYLAYAQDQKNIEIIGKVTKALEEVVGHKGPINNVSIIQRFTDVKKGDPNITLSSGQLAYFDDQGVEWSMGPHADNVYDMVTKSFVSSVVAGIVFYINDDYEGGEIVYVNKGITHKPKANSFVCHPAFEEYTHGVLKVKNGTRYILSTFIKNNEQ